MPHAPVRRLALVAIVLLAGCATDAAPSAAPASAAPVTSPTSEATPGAADGGALGGAWTGALTDPSGAYPVAVSLAGCLTIDAPCGEIEYQDPGAPDTVMCASELTLTARDGERFSFSERYVYRGWLCLSTTFAMTRTPGGDLDVEQFVAPGEVCCRGTLTARSGAAPAPEVPPSLGELGRATSAAALGGATTQYVGAAAGSLWFPLEDAGSVARVDATTGAVIATISTGDPGALADLKTDPHGVAAADGGVWVAQAAARSVSRIDPTTNTISETIALPVIPYALAIEGANLWVASFADDRVVRVDLSTGEVTAGVAVSKPTGIAVGLGGVWVVRHRDDVLVRIDPATNEVAAEIDLGDGPSDVCGMCVENVIVSGGSVWTANNEARSVGRVDPTSNKLVATIDLPLRPWAITAGDDRIWASQFTAGPDGAFVDQAGWAVASIDPSTNETTSFPFPGALSVFWAEQALWVVEPWRRGDAVIRVQVASP